MPLLQQSRPTSVPAPSARGARSAGSIYASRLVVLVLPSDRGFEHAVAALIEEAGYRAGHTVEGEPVALAFTRTQARAVICDFEGPSHLAECAALEALVRSVPVLLLLRGEPSEDVRDHAVAPGVSCAAYPPDAPALAALLASVLARRATLSTKYSGAA